MWTLKAASLRLLLGAPANQSIQRSRVSTVVAGGEKSMTSCSAPSVSTSETSFFYYSKQQEPTEPSVLWICAGPAVQYTERAAPVHRSVQRRRGGASARLGGMADGDAVLSVEWDSGDEGLAMDPEKTLTFCHGLQTMEVMHCTALPLMRTQLSAAVLQSNMLPSACVVVDKQQWPRHIIIFLFRHLLVITSVTYTRQHVYLCTTAVSQLRSLFYFIFNYF